ncbi:calcium-binding protein [Cupriavidus sp. BIS7]|uniref:calcium-binding protein n=1 Tax=Cupriavidus sp. BIS7 TaxID=1217718 RepID=UPI00047538FA|nr:calcium-binding protein [Cupriavidus sp. BIS7]
MTVRKLPAVGLAVMVALLSMGASAQQAPQPQPQAQQGSADQVPPIPPTSEAKAMISEKFKAADTNHDGKLTREEAKAGMPEVYKHFDQIDVKKKGYVTARQIGAYWQSKTQKQMQKENPIWN